MDLLKIPLHKIVNNMQDKVFMKRIIFKTAMRFNSNTTSSTEIVSKQNELFNKESKRQIESVGRIEKIEVKYRGTPQDVTLFMNKNISTPYNCAQHMTEMLIRRSGLALINGSTLWDMHRPLVQDCELRLLHFQDENPWYINKAFWRTCSLILGAAISSSFRSHVPVTLHSFPWPNVRSGSFVYDVELETLDNWKPTLDELKYLSAQMVKFARNNYPIERLLVGPELALEIFQHNKYKCRQIPDIAESSPLEKVTLYRMGDHIDISRGPMVGNTSFLGRCTVTAVHKLDSKHGNMYRFQGVALPKGILLNHYAYSILETKARKLNEGLLPWEHMSDLSYQDGGAVEAYV